jgi:SAM-dependent methyltransferase
MAESYERRLVPAVFTPFANDLAERAARAADHAPERVLELAAGTGVLTSAVLAALPGAEVVATDFNKAMVAVGEQRVPAATWQTADAGDLPFESATFDMVLCQFGVMFFPDKPTAFSEMRRVLTPNGSCLVSAWGPIDAHDFQSAVVDACDRMFPNDPPKFMRSVPHHYDDADDLVDDVEAGGLRVVEVAHVTLESPAASAADIAAGYCLGTPLRSEIEQRDGNLASVVAAATDEIERRLGTGMVRGRMLAHVVTCTPA